MREIKFRARRNDIKGEFQYFTLSQIADLRGLFSAYEDWSEYTGLKDKNGKEIYEGDILSGGLSGNAVVVFENGTFAVWGYPIGWDVEDFDELPEVSTTDKWANVIGNIYDNPELLK